MRKMVPAAAALLLAGCATPQATADPHDRFFQRIAAVCGQAFEGRVVSPPTEADREMASQRLVMHVSSCSSDTIRIPFHVGDDRSRTWVITRTADNLRLKHDHRHADGSDDRLTQYGGDTVAPGSARRQEFPADQHSRDLFVRENIPQSATNVWAIEVEPGRLFAYELGRPGRFFRVDFDLSRPVAAPPPPWGSD